MKVPSLARNLADHESKRVLLSKACQLLKVQIDIGADVKEFRVVLQVDTQPIRPWPVSAAWVGERTTTQVVPFFGVQPPEDVAGYLLFPDPADDKQSEGGVR